MSATTIRGSSPAEEIYSGTYPLAQRGVLTGFPYTGPLHTLGYWQSDNAIDIAVAVGTDVIAVTSGIIRARGDWSVPYNLSLAASGWDLLLFGDDGSAYFYSRLSQRYVGDGQHVVQGQVIGKSGGSNNAPHLHVAIQPQPANQALNPSFEHDALGAAPARWVNSGVPNPYTVFQVQNAWASEGLQSLALVTPTMSSGDVANAIIDSGVTVGGAGQVYTVAPGQQLAVRAGVNITAITGTMKLYSQVNWYGPTGTFLSTSSGTPVGGTPATTTPLNIVDGGVPGTSFVDNYDGGAPGTAFANSLSGGGVTTAIVTPGSIGPLRLGVAQLADVFTVPVGAGLVRVYFIAVSGANGSSMSYYLDGAMVVVGSSSATLPPGYSDNDNPANPQFRWG